MFEKINKYTYLFVFIISTPLLIISILNHWVFCSMISVMGFLYGGVLFLKLELNRPWEDMETDPYEIALKKQQTKTKYLQARKKIKKIR